MDKILPLKTSMCGRLRKGYLDTTGKSDFNRCLEGTRRIGGTVEAIKIPGR